MSAIERAARAINLSLHLDRRQIAEAVVASLRADLASGDPERVRETADALGLTVSPMAVVGGTSWSVRGISWYEPLKRDTLVPHDHTQRVPGCFRCDLSLLEVFNA